MEFSDLNEVINTLEGFCALFGAIDLFGVWGSQFLKGIKNVHRVKNYIEAVNQKSYEEIKFVIEYFVF